MRKTWLWTKNYDPLKVLRVMENSLERLGLLMTITCWILVAFGTLNRALWSTWRVDYKNELTNYKCKSKAKSQYVDGKFGSP